MQASVPPFDPAFLARFSAAAAAAGFRPEPFGEVAGSPLLAFSRRTAGPRPRIYVSAGVHGDEPASSLAALDLLESGVFDGRADWFVCPLLNPLGMARGRRENPAGIDLNRDYRDPQSPEARLHIAWLRRQPNFDLVFCLHEDWESTGVYLYERANPARPGLAEAVLKSMSRSLPIEPSSLIDGREAVAGVLRPGLNAEDMEKWPEAVYLSVNHRPTLLYTLETPSTAPLEHRVAAHRAAVEHVLNAPA